MYTKYTTIYLDGIDKSGKDTICAYIVMLSKYRYIVNSRGILSVIAYSNLYNRNFEYDIAEQKQIVNVLLTVDEDDWKIRCKLTNEKIIDYATNCKAFNDAYKYMQNKTILFKYNTSKMTAYEIAKDIVNKVEKLNNEN